MTDFSKAQVSIAALAAPSELQLLETMSQIQQKMLEAEQELLESQQKMDVAMGQAMKDGASKEADSMRSNAYQTVINSSIQGTMDIGSTLVHDPIRRKTGSYTQATNELHAAESWQTALKDLERQPGGQVRVGQVPEAQVGGEKERLDQVRANLKDGGLFDLSKPYNKELHEADLTVSSTARKVKDPQDEVAVARNGVSEAHDAFEKEVDRRVRRAQKEKDRLDSQIDAHSQRARNFGQYAGAGLGTIQATQAASYKEDAGEQQFLQQVAQYASTATQSATRSADQNVSGAEDNKRQTFQTMAKIAEANRA